MASRAESPVPLPQSSSVIADVGKLHVRKDTRNIFSPSEQVNLLKKNGVTNFKIHDVDHAVLTAFANSGISLVLVLPNEQLSSAANDQSFTDNWVNTNIFPYYPATNITIIAVGNEVIKQRPDLNSAIVPAMRNLYTSLQKLKLDESIKISIPVTPDVLSTWYPPSVGRFKSDIVGPVIKPLLDFLEKTSSFFVIDVDDVVFRSTAEEIIDPKTGHHYSNLLDALINAFYSAILYRQYSGRVIERRSNPRRNHHRVVMTAIGWRTLSDSRRAVVKTRAVPQKLKLIEASVNFVETSNEIGVSKSNGAKDLNGGGSIPSAMGEELEVYIDIFSLYNEDD